MWVTRVWRSIISLFRTVTLLLIRRNRRIRPGSKRWFRSLGRLVKFLLVLRLSESRIVPLIVFRWTSLTLFRGRTSSRILVAFPKSWRVRVSKVTWNFLRWCRSSTCSRRTFVTWTSWFRVPSRVLGRMSRFWLRFRIRRLLCRNALQRRSRLETRRDYGNVAVLVGCVFVTAGRGP